MNDIKVILASGSPRRKELLSLAGYDLLIRPSGADESCDTTLPYEMVCELSKRKCLDIADSSASTEKTGTFIVLGADTIVSKDKKILGKPASKEDAYYMLKMLSGDVHYVYTGVYLALLKDGKIVKEKSFYEETKVFVTELSDDEINEYIKTGEPMDKAGAYGIQGYFGQYIEKIDGDYYNVVGLPVCAVKKAIKEILL